MPRRLNRPTYGWSYTYGKDQRVPTEEYKRGYEKIKWRRIDTESWDTRKTRFGEARVKRYD